ncbi:MAG: nucleotidyl transferase AbiEii/AbiGii toxin family protein [Candidatus Micrarchaeota archaeon]|nr:nucleotidyl transferase AbiEii/AbiGii toxin family protein [Candidatus Micrarchaeota archaeon]
MVGEITFGIDELRDYAAKAGLGLQFVVKEAFMFELMELLGEKGFVLKGGTAINKGYLQGRQRFSEDLDYDMEGDKALAKKIVRGLGWPVRREYFTKHSIGFALAYEFQGVEDSVKVDVSFGIKGKSESRKASSDFLPVSKRVVMYEFPELNRQKELAFEERREWKDLYDLYCMSEMHPKEFRIHSKSAFGSALDSISVPKTANAFIPREKRPNWEEVRQTMRELLRRS